VTKDFRQNLVRRYFLRGLNVIEIHRQITKGHSMKAGLRTIERDISEIKLYMKQHFREEIAEQLTIQLNERRELHQELWAVYHSADKPGLKLSTADRLMKNSDSMLRMTGLARGKPSLDNPEEAKETVQSHQDMARLINMLPTKLRSDVLEYAESQRSDELGSDSERS
jgi:hypothetical protein